jgi:hypothetical protein
MRKILSLGGLSETGRRVYAGGYPGGRKVGSRLALPIPLRPCFVGPVWPFRSPSRCVRAPHPIRKDEEEPYIW